MNDSPSDVLSRQQLGAASGYYQLVPGGLVPGDWSKYKIPENVAAGDGTLINTAQCFAHFRSSMSPGLEAGRNCTFSAVSFNVEKQGVIQIGDDCFFSQGFLIATQRITIGSRVYLASGATVVDSDFHPLDPGERLWDTAALARGGQLSFAPFRSRPVEIGDDVWIGFNATILKGVSIGNGAIIDPGAVVSRDVAAGARVAGNPAVVTNSP
jgi:acetyltransferase-like isoleucine patch superfamily enzyme